MADSAGVNVETIRVYQRKSLLPEPERLYGGIPASCSCGSVLAEM